MTMLHTILGATGGAGRNIAGELIRAGHAVRTVDRSGTTIEGARDCMGADIETPTGATDAIEGSDVVYLAAQPPYHEWQGRFPQMLANVLTAVEVTGARLVMVDNLYMYGEGWSSMTDATPMRATDRKGRVRIEMVQMLNEAIDRGVEVTSGRTSDYFGPGGGNSTISVLAVERAISGERPRWMSRTDVPHSVAYLPDIARAYAILGTDDRAVGSHWILPHAGAPTGAEFLTLVTEAAGLEPSTATISKPMLCLAAPFHRMSREALGIWYQWSRPFVADSSRFEDTFGPFETTPLDLAVAETIGAGRTAVV